MTIDDCLHNAIEAKRLLEDNPCDDTEETYSLARSAFRVAVIEQMKGEVGEAINEYLVAAAQVSKAYEQLHALNGWFISHGVKSPLNNNFLKDVKLPDPTHGITNDFCGREVNYLVGMKMTEEGEQVFNNNYLYHDDHERMPPTPAENAANKAKAYNSALGR